jgi:hypothetical protein
MNGDEEPRAFGSSRTQSVSKSFFQKMFDRGSTGGGAENTPTTNNANKGKSTWHSTLRLSASSMGLSNHGGMSSHGMSNHGASSSRGRSSDNSEVVHHLLLQQIKLYENIIHQQAELLKSNNEIFAKIAAIEERSSLLQGGGPGGGGIISAILSEQKAYSTLYQSTSLKLGVEMASSFSSSKFASTLAAVRQTQVPPSHSLCFMYTSMSTARTLIDDGECPSRRKCGGVPLTLCGPDERFEPEYCSPENEWLYNATHIGEVFFFV